MPRAAAAARARSLTLVAAPYGKRIRAFAAASARVARDAAARRAGLADLPAVSDDDGGACLTLPEGAGPIVLALPFDASPGVVAHECAHAAVEVLKRSGVPVTARNDEALCHVLEDLVDRVSAWLARCRA